MPKNVSSVLHFCSAIVVLTLNLMAWSVINTKKRELKVLFFSYQIIFFIPIYSQKKCLLYMLFIRCKSYAAVMFIIILCICISLFCWKFTYLPYWTYCSSYEAAISCLTSVKLRFRKREPRKHNKKDFNNL